MEDKLWSDEQGKLWKLTNFGLKIIMSKQKTDFDI